jgi:hypothetical protein
MSAGFLLIHAKPSRSAVLALSWFLFAAGILAYLYTASARHRDNPEDRVTPTIAQMAKGMYDAALKLAKKRQRCPGGS